MFETDVLGFGEGRGRKRVIALGSVTVQAGLLGMCVVVPLLHPARLPAFALRPPTVELAKPRVKVEPPKPTLVRASGSNTVKAPTNVAEVHATQGAVITRTGAAAATEDVPVFDVGSGMARVTLPGGIGDGSGSGKGAAVVVVRAASAGPVRLSWGVTNGMLLTPIRPAYPPIAKAAGVQGTVVVTARIDREGRIVGLQVVSGPAMLRQAAEEAIREARYRPYLLNGVPTEVETTISVNFRVGG